LPGITEHSIAVADDQFAFGAVFVTEAIGDHGRPTCSKPSCMPR
jgi:hypothetical protein